MDRLGSGVHPAKSTRCDIVESPKDSADRTVVYGLPWLAVRHDKKGFNNQMSFLCCSCLPAGCCYASDTVSSCEWYFLMHVRTHSTRKQFQSSVTLKNTSICLSSMCVSQGLIIKSWMSDLSGFGSVIDLLSCSVTELGSGVLMLIQAPYYPAFVNDLQISNR